MKKIYAIEWGRFSVSYGCDPTVHGFFATKEEAEKTMLDNGIPVKYENEVGNKFCYYIAEIEFGVFDSTGIYQGEWI